MRRQESLDILEISLYSIVIVSGYMGSHLRDSQEGRILWMDIPGLLRDLLNIPPVIVGLPRLSREMITIEGESI